jgi:NAD(P)-dependent dehydrogenase (short-subunit alcohol dehydrogenase family)
MEIRDKVVVVTGGGAGIGRALCLRFAREGARAVVAADMDLRGAQDTVAEIAGGLGEEQVASLALAMGANVAREADVQRLVQTSLDQFGQIDVFCSNAGIYFDGDETTPNADWQKIWDVNVMAHVYAARAVLPHMLARGSGYLLQTASAAGLLNQIGSAPYGVTKHAAVGFAEWLALTYGERGIKVSCLCPQGVRTKMLLGEDGLKDSFLLEGSVSPEQVADAVVAGMHAEQFLILPHAEVREFMQRKSSDYDRWLRGMQRLRQKVKPAS